MSLTELQKNWHQFGEMDPLWAILAEPDKKNNRWDPRAFFQRGADEISQAMDYLAGLGATLRRDRALDFGCGVGRATQGLCRHFEQCCGVDIAPSMLSLARDYNCFGDRCRYALNETSDLACFPDGHFDLVYSIIVLQHIRPEYSRNYIREFLRVLAPGGIALFQVPSHFARKAAAKVQPQVVPKPSQIRRAPAVPKGNHPVMEMYGVPEAEVLNFLAEGGSELLNVHDYPVCGPEWVSLRYCARKAA